MRVGRSHPLYIPRLVSERATKGPNNITRQTNAGNTVPTLLRQDNNLFLFIQIQTPVPITLSLSRSATALLFFLFFFFALFFFSTHHVLPLSGKL